MIDTMIEHATRPTGQGYVLIAPTLLVIAPETEAMCTKDLIRNGYGIRKETETIGLLVKESDQETQIDAITTIEDPQKKSLNESVIGQNTSARRERNITTIVKRKSLSGRNLATGLIGRRKRNMSATESATDVIGIVIANESTTGNPIRRLVTVVVVRLKDIPILVVLVLCRIVTTIAVAVVAMWHHLVQRRIEIIIELISLRHRCRNSRSPEDTATVCCIMNEQI
jgi:hypothetical protein